MNIIPPVFIALLSTEIVERLEGTLNDYVKRFKYVVSHKTGKIKILSKRQRNITNPNTKNAWRIFAADVSNGRAWLDEVP